MPSIWVKQKTRSVPCRNHITGPHGHPVHNLLANHGLGYGNLLGHCTGHRNTNPYQSNDQGKKTAAAHLSLLLEPVDGN
jgi:hypothetical protein